LKIAETAIDTYVQETKRDRNLTFMVHATSNRRVIGYTVVVRPASNERPDIAVGMHYLGCFYSRLHDLARRQDRTIDILYHDQHIRLLAFGTKPSARDYLLVLRNRSD
jgi:hypothetical protein